MCFPKESFACARTTFYSGRSGGCPFYVDAEQYERWNAPLFVVDVASGAGSGMSLEGLHDLHFRFLVL